MAKITEVVAIEMGHDGSRIRQVGQRFRVDLDDPRFKGSTWFVKVGSEPEPKAGPSSDIPPGAGPRAGSAVDDEVIE